MLRPSGARMVSEPWRQSPSEHVPSAQFQSAIASPQSLVLAILQPIFKCQSGGLGGGGGACMIDVPTLAEVSTQPCKTEKTPGLGYCMCTKCTMYKVQRSAEQRGRGTHVVLQTHTRARRFSAPYSKSLQGRGQSTSHRARLPSLIPPSVPFYPGGMFPRWYHNRHLTPIGRNTLAYNPVYNLTIFRWASCPTPGSGARRQSRHTDP